MNIRRSFIFFLCLLFYVAPAAQTRHPVAGFHPRCRPAPADVSSCITITSDFSDGAAQRGSGTSERSPRRRHQVTNMVNGGSRPLDDAAEFLHGTHFRADATPSVLTLLRAVPATWTYQHSASLPAPGKQLAPAYRPAQPTVVPMSYLPDQSRIRTGL